MPARPSFDSLPLRKDGPPGNAWGLYGDDDELGTVNMLTPENTANAAREITDGTRVSTDWPLDSMTPPGFNRQPFGHTIHHKAPHTINDDMLTLNTQSSTQWDGLRHYGYQDAKLYYNGRTQEQVMSSTVNGTQAWVEQGGIVGRGVLLDYAAWAASNNVPLTPFETCSITAATLQQVAAGQGTTFRPGDILFVRTGWTEAYEDLAQAARAELTRDYAPPSVGLESSRDTLRWLWETGFAAVAGDHPAMEAVPFQSTAFCLHEWLIAGWGMPVGELFSLKRLAEECRKRQRWTFFFSSVPLHVKGGVASPPNGVAIF